MARRYFPKARRRGRFFGGVRVVYRYVKKRKKRRRADPGILGLGLKVPFLGFKI